MQTQSIDWRTLTAAGMLAGLPAGVFAESPQDNYWVVLEYFYPTISSTVRLDNTTTGRPGSTVKLEDNLDLADRKGTPYLTLGMRLSERWRLEFEYYTLKRSATKVTSREIKWGDVTFPAGQEIQSRFDSAIYRLTGGYSFYKQPTGEAGVTFGLHVTDLTMQLSGQGSGALGGVAFQSEERDPVVPLPTLGLYGTFLFADQWGLSGRADYLRLSDDRYDGSLINLLAAIDWRFAKNWSVGVGYRYVDYKVEGMKSDFLGEINYKFKGPTLMIQAAF